MLLSRLAERVYWAGRYLERAETTARMVRVHTELYLDLPRSAGLTWEPLLAVTGTSEDFAERYRDAGEDPVVRFLAVDATNPGSIRSSVEQARENIRVARAIFPDGAWPEIDLLYRTVGGTGPTAVERRTRTAWMAGIIRQCRVLDGMLDGVMVHDEAWAFLELGRHLERADMVTRVLEVQAEIMTDVAPEALEPYADVIWAAVLRSLNAFNMFRRVAGGGTSGPEALDFLLLDPAFPRSVRYCLDQVVAALGTLPRSTAARDGAGALVADVTGIGSERLDPELLRGFLDRLQVGIGAVHGLVAETYFQPVPVSGPPG